MVNILIDDIRAPGQKGIPSGVLIARSYFEGIKLLELHRGDVDHLFLDHDLGCFDGGREWTGYDVMIFLEWFSLDDPSILPKHLVLVTDNSVGRAKMQAAWDSIQKRMENSNDEH